MMSHPSQLPPPTKNGDWMPVSVVRARRRGATTGFTLIELLVVIGIIALLAGLLFPVFASVRGKARQATCQSNLRQIGMALQMYASDYDGQYPYAIDASDFAVAQMWSGSPTCQARIQQRAIPFLHPFRRPDKTIDRGALDTYVKSLDVWRCAADVGFDVLDNNDSCGGPCPMNARPTMFEAFGGSYLFRTEIAFRQLNQDTLSGWRRTEAGWNDVGHAEVNVLFDGNGSWHGGRDGGMFGGGRSGRRYLTLFADGHAKLLTYDQYQTAWATALNPNPAPNDYTCP